MAERRVGGLVGIASAVIVFLFVTSVFVSRSEGQDVDASDRERVLRNYQRYQRAPEQKREEVERQYQRWQQMPPEQRRQILDNYHRYRSMPREEQREFKRKYERWRQKPQP